jgi:hypothetical protein
MSTSSSLINRMIRAAKLEPALYEEVEADSSTIGQAVTAVIIVSICSGIGGAISSIIGGGGAFGIVMGLVVGIIGSLLGWLAWSFFTWIVGTTIFKGPNTKATWGELMRTIGFAYSPGVLRIFSFIPFIGWLISLVALIWSLIAGVVAVRQALDFDTGRAIGTCIVGWIAYVIVMVVVSLILAGIGVGLGLGMRGLF